MCSSRNCRRFFSDIKTYDDSYMSMATNFFFMSQETRLCHSFGVLQDEWHWHCGALACCRFVHFCHGCEKVGNVIVSTSYFESEIPSLQKPIFFGKWNIQFCHGCEKDGNGIVSKSFFESEIPALQKAIRDEFMMYYCNVIMHQKMTHDILSFFSQPKQR